LGDVYKRQVQPYLISLLRQKPGEAFARLQIPALIVQGSHDIQVLSQPASSSPLHQNQSEALPYLISRPRQVHGDHDTRLLFSELIVQVSHNI
ncbi:hypothetical protein ACQ4LH_21635, partial [Pseudomonas peli]